MPGRYPKGEYSQSDDPWAAAQREFAEEVGLAPPPGPRVDLGSVKQPGGKIVTVFAVQGDLDITDTHSNTFEVLEWPRGSGSAGLPEVDRRTGSPAAQAREKLLKGQRGFLDQLAVHLWPRTDQTGVSSHSCRRCAHPTIGSPISPNSLFPKLLRRIRRRRRYLADGLGARRPSRRRPGADAAR